MSDEFVHLHVHDDGSWDGAATSQEYADEARRLSQRALAQTNHGHLDKTLEHYNQCNRVGVKPILGAELYVSPAEMTLREAVRWGQPGQSDEDVSRGGAYTHLTVLAKDADGLQEMFRMQRDSYEFGYYYAPRVDRDRLAQAAGRIIVLSGCASGELATRLRLGQLTEADEYADWGKQVFGEDFYIELMYHDNAWEQKLIQQLIFVANRHDIRTVTTNDAHYRSIEDAPTHRAVCCVHTGSTLARPAMEFGGSGYHLRSRAEMEKLGLPAESLDETVAIAERIGNYDATFTGKPRNAEFELPEGWTAPEALRSLTEDGIQQRVSVERQREYLGLLYQQLDVIDQAGYTNYFLVVQHLVNEARNRGIRVGPGRGSAAASMAAFGARITQIDPLAFGLVPERFLNPERAEKSPPDIDIDISERRRPDFLRMAAELYGERQVAQIGTDSTYGAKRALLDAAKLHGLPATRGEWYAAQLPRAEFGRSPHIDQYTGFKDAVFNTAKRLYGLRRGGGIHASGMVFVSREEDLASWVPLRRPGGDGPWVTGFTDDECAQIGLVKFDFLGLRNLDIIADTEEHLRRREITPRLPLLPEEFNDRKTFALLSSGNTVGTFQGDGRSMRKVFQLVRPSRIIDVATVSALNRPGPMGAGAHTEFARRRNQSMGGDGWRDDWAVHPELREAFREAIGATHGLIVFQEDVLELLRIVCGWGYGKAALLFDAMRKKKRDDMAAARPDYELDGQGRGYSLEALTALWEILVPFADYSFNKAHASAYGVVSYWTTYLKANHPVEYMAATLSSVAGDPKKLPEYLTECRRMGLRLLPPSINGGGSFTPGADGIHYGLLAIKGVGQAVCDAITESRGNEPFSSVRDFFLRSDPRALSAGTLRALIQSGALDDVTPHREALYLSQRDLAAQAIYHRAERAVGQRTLLEPTFLVQEAPEVPDLRRQWEEEALGVALTPETAVLQLTRRLAESEWWWLRRVFDQHPGDTTITVVSGRLRMATLSGDWLGIKDTLRGFDGVECSESGNVGNR